MYKMMILIKIEISEVKYALNKLDVKSKTSEGITPKCMNNLLPPIIQMLLMMLNLIFKGGMNAIHQTGYGIPKVFSNHQSLPMLLPLWVYLRNLSDNIKQ